MRCEDFERDVFLFISGELSKYKSLKLKKHLENCERCAAFYKDAVDTFKQIEGDELYAPSEYIKKNIIDLAAKKRMIKSKDNLLNRIDKIFVKHYFNPVFSYGGVAVILLLMVFSIFKFNLLSINKNVNLKWDDNFMMQVLNIEQEVRNMENGEYDLALYDNLSINPEETGSVFSEDFIDLRKKVIEMIVEN